MLDPGRGEEAQEVKHWPGGTPRRTDPDTAHPVPGWWRAGVRPRHLEERQDKGRDCQMVSDIW